MELDIDAAIMARLKEIGAEAEFPKLDALITEYAKCSGRAEDGIALIVLDSLDTGMTAEQIRIQLEVHADKRGFW